MTYCRLLWEACGARALTHSTATWRTSTFCSDQVCGDGKAVCKMTSQEVDSMKIGSWCCIMLTPPTTSLSSNNGTIMHLLSSTCNAAGIKDLWYSGNRKLEYPSYSLDSPYEFFLFPRMKEHIWKMVSSERKRPASSRVISCGYEEKPFC